MKHPLYKKLLVKPGFRVLILNDPGNAPELWNDVPEEIILEERTGKGIYQAMLLFNEDSDALIKSITATGQHRDANTVIWSIYPKKSSNIPTDLHAMKPWEQLKDFGLEIVASAGINDWWTAVRIRPAGQSKPSGMCLEDIAQGPYGEFIDVVNRTVRMPGDMLEAVSADPAALAWFDQLSFSNKKEYVLWVISAKQEKTRISRIAQSLARLSAHKKNPSDK